MKQKYFSVQEKKQARARWNKKYYEQNKLLIQMAKRQISEQQKQQKQQKQNTKV